MRRHTTKTNSLGCTRPLRVCWARKRNRTKAKITAAELAKFVEDSIPGFTSLTNRPSKKWAEEVKDTRDQTISHSDPSSTVVNDGLMMHVMTNVLYIAGASFLLREMGVDENQVKKYIDGCSQTLLLSEQQ